MYMSDMTETKRRTMFMMSDYAGNHNNWNTSLLHPMHHTLAIVGQNGTVREITVGQLETFLIYAEQHKNLGSALDAVYHGAK